ncbi:MAG: chemotaxis protein, partial [Pseudomonadota bacterium]
SEQATSVSEITSTVTSMDQITQENATMAGQCASSSEVMTGAAQRLAELISFFKSTSHHAEPSRAA